MNWDIRTAAFPPTNFLPLAPTPSIHSTHAMSRCLLRRRTRPPPARPPPPPPPTQHSCPFHLPSGTHALSTSSSSSLTLLPVLTPRSPPFAAGCCFVLHAP